MIKICTSSISYVFSIYTKLAPPSYMGNLAYNELIWVGPLNIYDYYCNCN